MPEDKGAFSTVLYPNPNLFPRQTDGEQMKCRKVKVTGEMPGFFPTVACRVTDHSLTAVKSQPNTEQEIIL